MRHSILSPERDSDVSALWQLVAADAEFSALTHGREPRESDAVVILTARPPRTLSRDKQVVGFWDDERLVAIADIIRGHPSEGIAYIGLLQVDVRIRGGGVGVRAFSPDFSSDL